LTKCFRLETVTVAPVLGIARAPWHFVKVSTLLAWFFSTITMASIFFQHVKVYARSSWYVPGRAIPYIPTGKPINDSQILYANSTGNLHTVSRRCLLECLSEDCITLRSIKIWNRTERVCSLATSTIIFQLPASRTSLSLSDTELNFLCMKAC